MNKIIKIISALLFLPALALNRVSLSNQKPLASKAVISSSNLNKAYASIRFDDDIALIDFPDKHPYYSVEKTDCITFYSNPTGTYYYFGITAVDDDDVTYLTLSNSTIGKLATWDYYSSDSSYSNLVGYTLNLGSEYQLKDYDFELTDYLTLNCEMLPLKSYIGVPLTLDTWYTSIYVSPSIFNDVVVGASNEPYCNSFISSLYPDAWSYTCGLLVSNSGDYIIFRLSAGNTLVSELFKRTKSQFLAEYPYGCTITFPYSLKARSFNTAYCPTTSYSCPNDTAYLASTSVNFVPLYYYKTIDFVLFSESSFLTLCHSIFPLQTEDTSHVKSLIQFNNGSLLKFTYEHSSDVDSYKFQFNDIDICWWYRSSHASGGFGRNLTTYDLGGYFQVSYVDVLTPKFASSNGFQYLTYQEGEEAGYLTGFEAGKEAYSSTDGVFEIIKKAFDSFGSVFSIEVFPNITIGLLIGIPILIAIVGIVIKVIGAGK